MIAYDKMHEKANKYSLPTTVNRIAITTLGWHMQCEKEYYCNITAGYVFYSILFVTLNKHIQVVIN